MHYAVYFGHKKIFKKLLSFGNNDAETMQMYLLIAAKKNHFKFVRYLLKLETVNYEQLKKIVRRMSIGISAMRKMAHASSLENKLNVDY